MQSPLAPSHWPLAIIAAAAFALVFPAGMPAEEAPAGADTKLTRPLRVLDGVEVKFPDRSIFYRRVAPPAVPLAQPPVPVVAARSLSPAELAAAEARARKKSAVLLLSATVYDRRVTELHWQAGDRRCAAWSSIDFNVLAGHGEIETEDTVYWLIMGLGNETRESVADWNRFAPEWERLAEEQGLGERWELKTVPDLAKFPAGRSTYLLSGEAPADGSLAALDALHRYYDANLVQLTADYAKREAERAARAQWLKEHPPVPKDTVINFWPKKSRYYPTTGK